jgi:hypothetical protein
MVARGPASCVAGRASLRPGQDRRDLELGEGEDQEKDPQFRWQEHELETRQLSHDPSPLGRRHALVRVPELSADRSSTNADKNTDHFILLFF